MSIPRFRQIATMLTACAIAVPLTAFLGATPAFAATVGQNIATIAGGQTGDFPCSPGGQGYVNPGDSGNYSCNGSGGKHENWCADFAAWAWGQAGVTTGVTGYLNGAAASFDAYGQAEQTISSTPQLGDAVVFENSGSTIEHVGLVTGLPGGTKITITAGNDYYVPPGTSSSVATDIDDNGQVQTTTYSNYAVGQSAEGWTIMEYVAPAGGTQAPPPPVAAGGTAGSSSVISQPGGIVEMFFRGSDNNIWHDWYTPGIGWRGAEQLTFTGNVASTPSAVNSTTNTWDVFYKGSDGNLWHVYTSAGGPWSTASLGDGPLGGNPEAVAESNGIVEVFWRGTDNNVWHGWYTPGGLGWRGPEQLTTSGNVVDDPAPANSTTTTWDVFYKGTDGNLWHVYTSAGGPWSTASLGDGPLGGDPKAMGRSDGMIEVYWRGQDNNLWHAWYTPGSLGWRGPERLSSAANMASDPAPVNTNNGGTWDNFYLGTDGNLWHVFVNAGDSSWTTASLGDGTLGSQPMAAGQSSGVIDVFWKADSNPGGPWHAAYTGSWNPAGAMPGTMY